MSINKGRTMPEQDDEREIRGVAFRAKSPAEMMAALREDQPPAESVQAEPEQAPVPLDVEGLGRKAAELHGMSEIQMGLEMNIVGGGLNLIAKRYGGDRVLDVLQERGEGAATTMAEVIAKLEPDEDQRSKLFAEIEAQPIDEIAAQMNETLGGVNIGTGADNENLRLFRHHELMAIRAGRPTDAANYLLTGNFIDLMINHPELADGFRQSNDAMGLLQGIRGVYSTEYTDFISALERAKAEAARQIQGRVNERLKHIPAAGDMQDVIDIVRAQEAKAVGVDRLDGLRVAAPVVPQPIERGLHRRSAT